ncbi:MAG: hypothetical protein HQK89_13425 [Nitrospirae bacterium]|nr:hypothetical protein [Nitrospirota bacterium]
MDTYNVEDIFTPATTARKNFIERDGLDARLQKALQTPGIQIIIYGHTGLGKSAIVLNTHEKNMERNQ